MDGIEREEKVETNWDRISHRNGESVNFAFEFLLRCFTNTEPVALLCFKTKGLFPGRKQIRETNGIRPIQTVVSRNASDMYGGLKKELEPLYVNLFLSDYLMRNKGAERSEVEDLCSRVRTSFTCIAIVVTKANSESGGFHYGIGLHTFSASKHTYKKDLQNKLVHTRLDSK